MIGPTFVYDDGREIELEWRPIKTTDQTKARQPRPPHHWRGRERGGPFLVGLPPVEGRTLPSFGVAPVGGGDKPLEIELPMPGDGDEVKPVPMGDVIWVGTGIDRRRVAFLGSRGNPTHRSFPIELDRRWDFWELQVDPSDDGWIDIDARHQALEILEAHRFPTQWGVERRNGELVIPLGDGNGFGHAWAWIGSKLCWAKIPEEGLLDRSEFRSEFQSTHIPTRSTWADSKTRQFHRAFPIGAPFHWALRVLTFVHGRDCLMRNWAEVTAKADPANLFNLIGNVGYNLGQFMGEHRLRDLHSNALEEHFHAEETEAGRIVSVVTSNQVSADRRWRRYALEWLKARREEKPAHGQGALADDLIDHCNEKQAVGDPVAKLPKRDRIIEQISKWEGSGDLERGTRNPTGKR